MSEKKGDTKTPAAEASPLAEEDSRRAVLLTLGIGGLSVGLAAVFAPAAPYVLYPLDHETIAGGAGFLPVGKLKRFKDGVPQKVDLFSDKKDAWNRVLDVKVGSVWVVKHGAKVIKIEKPGTGDETRGWGPPFDDRGESAYYLSVNRNKMSAAADLDVPADRDLVLDLIGGADVVVDNFRPGSLERRGISPEQVLRTHEKLIWCTISGFGPGSDRAGYDLVVQAESGWMSITGDPDGEPTRVGVALADIIEIGIDDRVREP